MVVNDLSPPQVPTQHIYPDKPVRDEQTNLHSTTVSIKFQVLNGVHYVQGKLKVRIYALLQFATSICQCYKDYITIVFVATPYRSADNTGVKIKRDRKKLLLNYRGL